jgi:hypothetical protein
MCALHNKIKKQLAVETPEPKGNKIRPPLVLSDSKGSYLRNEVNYNKKNHNAAHHAMIRSELIIIIIWDATLTRLMNIFVYRKCQTVNGIHYLITHHTCQPF